MMMPAWLIRLPLPVAFLLPLASIASAVTIDWVTVGGAANACDAQTQGCFGSVPTEYRIGKYEVTNDQYAEFLNAVADTDTNALYDVNMGSGFGGITRDGSSGSFTYSTVSGREEMPVNYVSFYDSLRFANWMHNGQGTGPQGITTTEDGAYTITLSGISSNSVTRNAEAAIFIPSEDEWYKAAYYDPISMTYFDFPNGNDAQTTCAAAGPTANTANCIGSGPLDLSEVGSYTGASSPGGTFDQGGNVFEWNEAILVGSERGARGGSFGHTAVTLAAFNRYDSHPSLNDHLLGFRVVSVPEPSTALLLSVGLVGGSRSSGSDRAERPLAPVITI